MPFTEAGLNHLLNTYFAAYTVYVAMHSGVPDQLNAVSDDREIASFTLAENGHVSNDEAIDFPHSPAVTMTHASLQLADRTIIGWGELLEPITPIANSTVRIARNDLDITLL